MVGEATAIVLVAFSISQIFGPLLFGLVVRIFLHTTYPGAGFLVLTIIVGVGQALSTRIPPDSVINASHMNLPPDSVVDASQVNLDDDSTKTGSEQMEATLTKEMTNEANT
eukprot:gnl/MRDRNA2_/MRDRNA2_66096_c0_seq1.p1 gnl/MRDRNA2_/MRDRNA2_66096_c0~~gnl/MRDRNA2_/MRDRNA2_66096_c0_seq1.p1  ORF type:complete len:111 (+),score=18.02 gnl/MRDRNA2_/MRDRNA2_66096_c0_seq1:3-335(+)